MIEAALLEPYIKEKNILQLGLFYLGKGKAPKKMNTEWTDEEGRMYKLISESGRGIPGAFDLDVYTACMRIWVRQGMPRKGIETNYSGIARVLGLDPKSYNRRIKQSLMRLGKARYELHSCFIAAKTDGTKEMRTAVFSLFDTVDLFEYQKGKSKKKSKFVLVFSEGVRENLEAKYYQWLDMAWYRALPGGMSRRLYEYLEKRRYHGINRVFTIGEKAICRWLPITDQHTTKRRERLERYARELIKAGYLRAYNFDMAKKQCTFKYAQPGPPRESEILEGKIIEAQPTAQEDTAGQVDNPGPQQMQQAGAKPRWADLMAVQEWLESIPYFHKRKMREIASLPVERIVAVYPDIRAEYERVAEHEKPPGPAWIHREFMKRVPAEERGNAPGEEDLQELVAQISKDKCPHAPKSLKSAIASALREHGRDYVAGSIEYANRYSRKNYVPYLKGVLEKNQAADLIEQKKARAKREEREREEDIRKAREREEQERIRREREKERARFLEKAAKIPQRTRQLLWNAAEQEAGADARPMQVALQYKSAVLDFFADTGDEYDRTALEKLDIAQRMAAEFMEQVNGK